MDPWLGAAPRIGEPLIIGQVAPPLTRCQCSMALFVSMVLQKSDASSRQTRRADSQNAEHCHQAPGGVHGTGPHKATLFQVLGRRAYGARWHPGLRNNVEAIRDSVTDRAEDLQESDARSSWHVREGKAGWAGVRLIASWGQFHPGSIGQPTSLPLSAATAMTGRTAVGGES